jgi:hypothetical protein
MMTGIIEKTVTHKNLLTVEQKGESNFITVKKRKKNTDYEVKLFLFEKKEIDDLLELQNKFYSSGNAGVSIKDRLLAFFKSLIAIA